MKTQHFTLSIPEPCSEAWEQMTPCGSGKFCDSCQKTVIDFTDYSEAQIAAFLADKRGESVCGRFYAAQIEEAVFSYVAPAKKSYRTLAMAASVAALTVMSFTADGQELQRDERYIPLTTEKLNHISITRSTDTLTLQTISGTVKDVTGDALGFASLTVKVNRITYGDCKSNENGQYRFESSIRVLRSDTLEIKCSYITYVTKEVVIPVEAAQVDYNIDFILEKSKMSSTELEPIGTNTHRVNIPLIDKDNPGSKTTITAPQLEKMPR